MKNRNYVDIVLILLKCLVTVYILYMIMVLFLNIFLDEASGEIYYYNKYQEKVIDGHTRFGGGLKDKGYVERNIWKTDLYYKYTVNGNTYSNSRVSNILIFPGTEFIIGNTVTVYYNKIIPKYSLLYKCNYVYFLINIIPIAILLVIIILIKKYTGRII
jgi:hypothetical protein